MVRVEANPEAGFHWPYFLVRPETVRPNAPILVLPNNDGRSGAPYETHLYWASLNAEQSYVDFARHLNVVTLTPAFPRPRIDGPAGNLYIHALSRAALLATDPTLARPDLQLLAMAEDARGKLRVAGFDPADDMLLFGFSAAGDFVTRMAALHPESARAVAAGGLGGFPMLPVAALDGDPLTYPVGVGDMANVAGRPFDRDGFRKTPHFLFQGGADDNDSVPERAGSRRRFGSDSYDYDQTVFINDRFGRDPVGRLDRVRAVYDGARMTDFAYALEPGVDHRVTQAMDAALITFFECVLDQGSDCAARAKDRVGSAR